MLVDPFVGYCIHMLKERRPRSHSALPPLDELGNHIEEEPGFCSSRLRKSRSVTAVLRRASSHDVCDLYIRMAPEPHARLLPLRTTCRS